MKKNKLGICYLFLLFLKVILMIWVLWLGFILVLMIRHFYEIKAHIGKILWTDEWGRTIRLKIWKITQEYVLLEHFRNVSLGICDTGLSLILVHIWRPIHSIKVHFDKVLWKAEWNLRFGLSIRKISWGRLNLDSFSMCCWT